MSDGEAARWQRAQAVLDAVLAAPPEARERCLELACGGDAALRDEVRALLRHEAALADEQRAAVFADWLAADDPRLDPARWRGRDLGPWRIDELLGRGGSSLVFRAHRRDEFTQRVAIKLLHGAGAPSRRFLRERGFLAALQHPGIARLYDAGRSEDGVPYLVLELVEGRRWDEELAATRPPLRWRLERFAAVCDAVAHAHQRLLVHRDIKPANLVVDRDGAPHLLDFGIARLLDDAAGAADDTRELGPALTPGYAAPEQLRGEPPTTATDVHALGVLLYETLTGINPFRAPGEDAARTLAAVAEHVPVRPSVALARLPDATARPPYPPAALAGDLDLIALTALAKDPARRYASARQLGDDVRAHLEGRPITARAPSLGYVAGKFARRHRLGVALGALALLALLAAGGAALWQSRIASAERERAEQRLVELRRFVGRVLFEYHEGIQPLAGSLPMQRRMVEDALQYLESLRAEAGGDATLAADLAEGYLKIGDLQGNPYVPNLGDFAGAARSYDRALAATAAIDAHGDGRTATWLRARLRARQAHLHHQASALDAAAASYRDALREFEALGEDPGLAAWLEHATALDLYGDLLGRQGQASIGDRQGALQAHARARALRERAATQAPDDPRVRSALYHSQLRTGEDLMARGEMADARAALRDALASSQALLRDTPADARRKREVALVHSRLAAVEDALGETEAAIADALQSFRIVEAMSQADPGDDALLQAVTGAAGWAARFLIRAGRLDEATPIVARQIEANRQRLAFAPGNPEILFALSLAQRRQGELLAGRGEHAAAVAAHREALELQEPLVAHAPEFALGVPLSRTHIAGNLLALREHAAAGTAFETAAAELQALAAAHAEALGGLHEERAAAYEGLAEARLGEGDCARAAAALRDALAQWAGLGTLLPPQVPRRDAAQARLDGLRCAG